MFELLFSLLFLLFPLFVNTFNALETLLFLCKNVFRQLLLQCLCLYRISCTDIMNVKISYVLYLNCKCEALSFVVPIS